MRQIPDNLIALSVPELRTLWAELWRKQPHRYIRRPMLEKGIVFKQAELQGRWLDEGPKVRLNQLVRQYKRDKGEFDGKQSGLDVGTQIIRVYRGKTYYVMVHENGFGFEGRIWSSLSEIASHITGTRWNGWVFFGLKKRKGAV